MVNPDADDHKIVTACQISGAHGFISRLPQGYQTVLGEGGAGLSAGELRKLALAQLFLRNPSVLILDEPSNDLDSRAKPRCADAAADCAQAHGHRRHALAARGLHGPASLPCARRRRHRAWLAPAAAAPAVRHGARACGSRSTSSVRNIRSPRNAGRHGPAADHPAVAQELPHEGRALRRPPLVLRQSSEAQAAVHGQPPADASGATPQPRRTALAQGGLLVIPVAALVVPGACSIRWRNVVVASGQVILPTAQTVQHR
ncbi:Mitochondrial potassium channel ATP-binding subunit [Manis javanica]|nr:Mitochondrial potassium channel ATP-binding subunit [Manis javanica]